MKNKSKMEKPKTPNLARKPANPNNTVSLNEVEEKLKAMRQKRLTRLSTFIVEESKPSEERGGSHDTVQFEDAIMSIKKVDPTLSKSKFKATVKKVTDAKVAGTNVTMNKSSTVHTASSTGLSVAELIPDTKNYEYSIAKNLIRSEEIEKINILHNVKTSSLTKKDVSKAEGISSAKRFIDKISCVVSSSNEDLTEYEKTPKLTDKVTSTESRRFSYTEGEEPRIKVEKKSMNKLDAKKVQGKPPFFQKVEGSEEQSSHKIEGSSRLMKHDIVLEGKEYIEINTSESRAHVSEEELNKRMQQRRLKEPDIVYSLGKAIHFPKTLETDKVIQDLQPNKNEECSSSVGLSVIKNESEGYKLIHSSSGVIETNEINHGKIIRNEGTSKRVTASEPLVEEETTKQSNHSLNSTNREYRCDTDIRNQSSVESGPHTSENLEEAGAPKPKLQQISYEEKVLKKLQRNWISINEILETNSIVDSDEMLDLENNFEEAHELLQEYKTKLQQLNNRQSGLGTIDKIRKKAEDVNEQIGRFRGLRRDNLYGVLTDKLLTLYVNSKGCSGIRGEKSEIATAIRWSIKELEQKAANNEMLFFKLLQEQVDIISSTNKNN